MYLNFNVTNLNPSNANNRAYGLQLRCLSAFIAGRREKERRGKSDVRFFLFRPSAKPGACLRVVPECRVAAVARQGGR
ncbi:hypothetical protein [uncultured Rikenella sp.]|uniref:hypothetical protein n=1 Tax=uncultured Rikenella sp. TaxID=368003 RepID=UPI0025CFD6E4|nr:hypothetical protein [uncultured Rikenella sp.]